MTNTVAPHAQITEALDLILSDPDCDLSDGALRSLRWIRTWVSVPFSVDADRTQSVQAVTEHSERAAFEAWIKQDAGDLSTFGQGQNLHYSNSAVNNSWTGWKARASLALPTPKAQPEPAVGCHECHITHDLGACAKAQPVVEPTWLTSSEPTPERQFTEWLNSVRGQVVSSVFHEIMQRYAQKVAPAPNALDAERWRTFIGLPHEIRAEWASNLSLVPILTEWVDQASKDVAQSAQGAKPCPTNGS